MLRQEDFTSTVTTGTDHMVEIIVTYGRKQEY